MIRSVNFLLTLAAVVAATLLVTPLPAVAETEAPNPPAATPLEVERAPVGVAGLAASAVCSAATAGAPATDIDPGCFDECRRELKRCRDAATTRAEEDRCWREEATCESDCIYGGECSAGYPWWLCATPPARAVPETTAQRPAAKDSGTPGMEKSPVGGVLQYDAEEPGPPQPHF